MSFSDEDLKRLERTFARPEYHQDISEDIAIWILNKQEALIQRLRCAEAVIDGYIAKDLSEMEGPDMETHNKNVGRFFEALEDWCKSKGIDEEKGTK